MPVFLDEVLYYQSLEGIVQRQDKVVDAKLRSDAFCVLYGLE
jgi:hypothetical protein